MVSRPVLGFQHSTKFAANPPKLVALYFDCMSAPVWRGGDDAVQRDAVRPVVQRQRRHDDRLDHRAAYPVTANQWIEFPTISCRKPAAASWWEGFGTGELRGSDRRRKSPTATPRLSGRLIAHASTAAERIAEQVGRTPPLPTRRASEKT
jgi:hypothetical protein